MTYLTTEMGGIYSSTAATECDAYHLKYDYLSARFSMRNLNNCAREAAVILVPDVIH